MDRDHLVITLLLGIFLSFSPHYRSAPSHTSAGENRIQETKPPLPDVFGLAYGPYRQHESPDGLQPTEAEIREDLRLLKAILPEPRRIRVYSAIGPGGLAAIIASEEGFLVTLGAWIDEDQVNNEKEITELIRLVPVVKPELVVVGNERLLRINSDREKEDSVKVRNLMELKDYIHRVKLALPGVKVSTAEPWATWVVDPRGEVLASSVDMLMVHVHPFWEKTPIEEAPQAVFQRLNEVKAKFGKSVVLGETGWPSNGESEGEAVPNEENQRRFISDLIRLSAVQDVPVFLFSAFDEPYKGIDERGSDSNASAEGPTGAHWGIFLWNRSLKPLLLDIFGSPGDPDPTSSFFRILSRGWLAPGFNYDLDTGMAQRDWVRQLTPEEAERPDGSSAHRLSVPRDQCYGTFFITTGKSSPDLMARRMTNLGDFDRLAIDLRLIEGEGSVELAVKNPQWPDDGTESKVVIEGLTRQWQTAVIPLSYFSPTDLRRLYVVTAINFFGMAGKTVDVAEIRFLPNFVDVGSTLSVAKLLSRGNIDPVVLKDGKLSCGYGLGIATAAPLVVGWVEEHPGFLRFSYPGRRDWGSVFITVGNPPPSGGQRLITDLIDRSYLALEMRGGDGGEYCDVGVRSLLTSPHKPSLALTRFELSHDWAWYYVPLNSIPFADIIRMHVVTSIEFLGPGSRTIEVRNIRLLSDRDSSPATRPTFRRLGQGRRVDG